MIAESTTSQILTSVVKPSHRIISGARAMRGMAKKPQRYGEVMRSAVGDMPIQSPSGTPMTSEITSPMIIA